MNNLPMSFQILTYADNTLIYYIPKDAKEIGETLTTELTLVNQWLFGYSLLIAGVRENVFSFSRVKHLPEIFLDLSILNSSVSVSFLE